MPEYCRSCKAPIRWAVTGAGYPMPINPEPAVKGNLRLDRASDGAPRVVVVPPAQRVDGEQLYLAHFVTCPFADQHRRPR